MAIKRRAKTAKRTKGRKRTKRRPVKRKAPEQLQGSHRVHSVKSKLTVGELAKAGSALNLEVFGSGLKIGELEIGRGSLFWRGGNRQTWKRIRWPDFAEMMDELAYRKVRKRKPA